MKRFFLILCLGGLAALQAAEPLQPSDFNLDGNSTFHDGVFTVTIPKTPGITNETRGIRLKRAAKFAGKSVRIRAEMRWRNIESDAVGPHVGGKILSAFRKADGSAEYYFSRILTGNSKDWEEVSTFCSFPADLKSASVAFGIQQAWGVLEIRNPTWEYVLMPQNSIKLPENFRCEYSPAVKAWPIRRGVMSPVPKRITEQDIRDLAAWNVNLIRYQMVMTDGVRNVADLKEYNAYLDVCLDKLDELTPLLKKHNIKVVIAMMRPPGGRYRESGLLGTAGSEAAKAYGNDARFLIMEEPAYRQAFLDCWKHIATRYKGNPVVYGYDLVNEPVQIGPAKFNWWDLQYDAAKAIRAIDPETPIVIEGNDWDSSAGFVNMTPLPLKNIIYQFHMYIPGEYTHQGVQDKPYADSFPEKSWDYRDRGWNREKLRDAMQPVIDFQKKYGAKIFAGEFSASIWAPGAAAYLADVIAVFEENKWDWTYHAFREWEGWSLEHAGTPNDIRPSSENDRKKVVLDSLKRNRIQ